jgi:hypothetical protein
MEPSRKRDNSRAKPQVTFPQRERVYAVRSSRIMPDGELALRLIGITVSRFRHQVRAVLGRKRLPAEKFAP